MLASLSRFESMLHMGPMLVLFAFVHFRAHQTLASVRGAMRWDVMRESGISPTARRAPDRRPRAALRRGPMTNCVRSTQELPPCTNR